MGRTVAFSPIGVVGTSPAEKRDHEERGRRGGREGGSRCNYTAGGCGPERDDFGTT